PREVLELRLQAVVRLRGQPGGRCLGHVSSSNKNHEPRPLERAEASRGPVLPTRAATTDATLLAARGDEGRIARTRRTVVPPGEVSPSADLVGGRAAAGDARPGGGLGGRDARRDQGAAALGGA